jgi:hypothetical protein
MTNREGVEGSGGGMVRNLLRGTEENLGQGSQNLDVKQKC